VTEVADQVKENPHQIYFSQVADLMHIFYVSKDKGKNIKKPPNYQPFTI
jgi:hypothetical protein